MFLISCHAHHRAVRRMKISYNLNGRLVSRSETQTVLQFRVHVARFVSGCASSTTTSHWQQPELSLWLVKHGAFSCSPRGLCKSSIATSTCRLRVCGSEAAIEIDCKIPRRRIFGTNWVKKPHSAGAVVHYMTL